MSSPLELFTVTLYCFALTLVPIRGEIFGLINVDGKGPRTGGYTCISDDDGSALVWSRNDGSYTEQYFLPRRRQTGNVRDCGIREPSSCLAKWDETSDWRVVNSAAKPTGPVFDHRLEDFPGLEDIGSIIYWQFGSTRVVNKSSSTIWFSGTNSHEGRLGVLLCEREKPELGPCVWVRGIGHVIEIQSCASGAVPESGAIDLSKCTVESRIDGLMFPVVDNDEWNTFRLDWNTRQKTVKLFVGNNSEPLVKGPMPPWDKVFSVAAAWKSHLRFHFFDYRLTYTKNVVISTKGIEHSGKLFCAELLLALRPRCKLSITLMDEDGSDIESWSFSGDKQDPYKGLLAWRLVRLTTSFDSDIPRRLTLKIKTILDGDEGAGEWAIDNFRICQTGKLRQSVSSMYDTPLCQKMSYAGNSIVKLSLLSANETQALSELQDIIRNRNITQNGRGRAICSTSGCICNRGFTGRDIPMWDMCMDECADGSYGYSCTKKCGSCRYSEPCVKSTGFCRRGCHRDNMLKPFCKTAIVAPIVENVGSTTVTLLQNVEIAEEDEVPSKIKFQIREAGGESWMNFTAKRKGSKVSSGYGAHIAGLKPNTAYVARAVAFVGTELGPTATFGLEYNLMTTCLEESRLMVTPSRKRLTIVLDKKGQIHSNLGNSFSVLVTDTLTGDVASSACGMSFPFSVTGLTPSTEYEVKIIDTKTRCTLLDTRCQTSGPVPSEVRNFSVRSVSDTEVTLQWDRPARKKGAVIRNYSVSLELTELRGCKNLNKLSPPEDEIVRIVNETMVFFDGLHPYAKYVASVVAQTSEPGPPVSLTFETNATVIPSSMVSNLRVTEDKRRIVWDKPADCATITGPTKMTRLFVTRVSDSAFIEQDQTGDSHLDLSNLHLEPVTWYKVRVHVIRDYGEPENPDVYRELTWKTNLKVAHIEALDVVNVTNSTARIIQNVAAVGHDAKVFVAFILREVSSNESFALLPTHTSGVKHELDLKNLKPKAHYKVHSLVTVLESDRAVTLDGSPELFETKCLVLAAPSIEVSPGEHDLTIDMPTRPEDCERYSFEIYSINVYDTTKDSLESSTSFESFPITIPDLNPDTEYELKFVIRSSWDPIFTSTTKVRTSALKEAVPETS